jgi:uncharacterized protein (DUF924 family)
MTAAASALPETAGTVLEFWFGPPDDPGHRLPREHWFRKDPAFDQQVRERFGSMIDAALAGQLRHWSVEPEGALAQVIVLDQFTRNAFRGTARAFAGDPLALAAARAMVETGQDRLLTGVQRQFVYLPFEHAEDLAAQQQALQLFTRLAEEEPARADLVRWAQAHHDVVARFGRFPHRNAVLARPSTPEEKAFLKTPGSSF